MTDNWWGSAPLAQNPAPVDQSQQSAWWNAAPLASPGGGVAQDPNETASDEATGYARSAIGQGLAAGFGDEIEAYARSKLNNTNYDNELDQIRGEQKKFEQRHPVGSTLAEMGGGLATMLVPGMGEAEGLNLAARAARVGAEGAAYGGLYGFGSGEGGLENRAENAGVGAAAGGVLGAAAPLAGATVSAVASPLVKTVRAAMNPMDEAARRVGTSIEMGQSRGEGLTPQQFTDAQARQQPVANIDRGGETTRALARATANADPEARETLNNMLNDRIDTAGNRIENGVNQLFGGNVNAYADNEALAQRARQINRPAYNEAYSSGSDIEMTPTMSGLTNTPEFVGAMKSAVDTGKTRAVLDGMRGFNPPVSVDKDGIVAFNKGGGIPTTSDLQYWDYVQRDLKASADRAVRAGDNDAAGRFTGLRGKLLDELDTQVPKFADARQRAAQFFGGQDALEAGQNFLSKNVDMNEARAAHSQMSAPEQELFARGYADSLVKKIQQSGIRSDIANQLFKSNDSLTRMQMALGPHRANSIDAMMGAEQAMSRARPAVQGNSTTARQIAESMLVGEGANYFEGNGGFDPLHPDLGSALVYGLARRGGSALMGRVNRNVVRNVATMLTSDDPAIYARGARTAAMDPRMMALLRTAGRAPAVAGVQAATGD